MKSTRTHLLQSDFWFGQSDSRPIAMFRILLALLLLKDAIYHLPLARVFFSDTGILPRSVLLGELSRHARLSLMDTVAHDWQAVTFFLIWIGILLGMLVGYRTRWMTVLNFIFVLSIHERNVYILTGADSLFRVFSFWLMFSEAGKCYSIDAAMRRGQPNHANNCMTFALPLRMMQIQLFLVYFTTGYFKAISSYWQDGEALFYVFQLQGALLPPGEWLRDLGPGWLLTAATHWTVVVELLLPFLLWVPIWQPYARGFGLLNGLLLHGGIALTLTIPDFSMGMLATYVLFFEPEWINAIESRLGNSRLLSRLINSRLVQSVDGRISPPLTPVQSLDEGSKGHLSQVIMSGVLPTLMLMVIWWNIESTWIYREHPVPEPPRWVQDTMRYVGLWQYWDLFAPVPYMIDGRLVIEGRFENGAGYNLYTGTPLTVETPPVQFGPDLRWLKLEENVFNDPEAPLMTAWSEYYCTRYNVEKNAIPGARLKTLKFNYVYRRSHDPGEPVNDITTEVLWDYDCLEPENLPQTG